ncbi:MAG TPA: guanylate kinase [Phycisphaerales bacterium]|nr:guanylate kinase [Phycisphaerales bacterium]
MPNRPYQGTGSEYRVERNKTYTLLKVYAEAGMTGTNSKKGRVVIVSGPSGVGKSTICKEILKKLDYVSLSISVTTRPKSEAEIDGQDYWFISEEDFRERIEKGLLLEYAEVFGHMYGTPKDKVDEELRAGKVVILEIDVQGAIKARVVFPDAAMVFILPPSAKDLAERLNNRGREAGDVAEERLNGASAEIAAAWQYYQHMVINEDLQQAVNECVQIIEKTGTET